MGRFRKKYAPPELVEILILEVSPTDYTYCECTNLGFYCGHKCEGEILGEYEGKVYKMEITSQSPGNTYGFKEGITYKTDLSLWVLENYYFEDINNT